MANRDLTHALLQTLFRLARATRPAGIEGLSRALAAPRAEVARALLRLDSAGLVDASRLRLTLAGLAVAAASGRDRRTRIAASWSLPVRERRAVHCLRKQRPMREQAAWGPASTSGAKAAA